MRKFKPGDRSRRWKTGSNLEAITSFILAAIIVANANHPIAYILGGGLALLGVLAYRDGVRGWKIRYDLPPWGERDIKRGGIRGRIARAAWEDTQRDAARRDRKKYSFDEES